ncbi:MAG TPA: nucleoside recognition domain-containing protein, partial [Candidatus Entotheonella sp.]
PYHLPTWNGLVLRTWERLKTFLYRAGQVIVLIVVLLSFLNSLGTDGSFGHQNRETSMLSTLSRSVSPLFAPMGLREDNWPALVGIVTGVFAKEAVVGTLDALYTELATSDTAAAHAEAAAFDLWGGVRAAFASIPTNLADVTHTLLDPLGISVGEVRDLSAAAAAQEVRLGTFGTMVNRFDGRVGAFAYLLFILLYFPCVAATAAVYRETHTAWTVFIAAWSTGLAYYVAVTFYQVARFAQHPVSSALWAVGLTALLLSAVLLMRVVGRNPMHRWSLVRQTTAPVLSTLRR